MNQVTIRRIKFSTVGIGVHNYTKNEIHLIGSGFFYDTRGYLMSAGHVLKYAQEITKILKERKQKVKIISINLNILDLNKIAAIGAAMAATLFVAYLTQLNFQQEIEGKKK